MQSGILNKRKKNNVTFKFVVTVTASDWSRPGVLGVQSNRGALLNKLEATTNAVDLAMDLLISSQTAKRRWESADRQLQTTNLRLIHDI